MDRLLVIVVVGESWRRAHATFNKCHSLTLFDRWDKEKCPLFYVYESIGYVSSYATVFFSRIVVVCNFIILLFFF